MKQLNNEQIAELEQLKEELEELEYWITQPIERILKEAPLRMLETFLQSCIDDAEYEICAPISKAINYRKEGKPFTVTAKENKHEYEVSTVVS